MKKNISLILIVAIVFCGWIWNKKKPAIKIGPIEITAQEFNDAFNSSPFARSEDVSAKKKFLENFISRKLILKEAEEEGLDKNPEFLKDVQLFWEQSLLKLMLSRKIKELSSKIKVQEDEIKNYYSAHKNKEFAGKNFAEVYDQIKWLLFNQKQQRALEKWIESLKEKTKINIDYSALGIKK